MGFQGAEIHVFPNEAMWGKGGGVAEASKEIRSLGRDSKRVVMPRREGYCGYTASSCTCLPVWGVGGSWCRACLHSRLPSRCSLRTKWEGEVPGLRPCLPLLRPHDLRALQAFLRIVTVVSCRGKTHNWPPYYQLRIASCYKNHCSHILFVA